MHLLYQPLCGGSYPIVAWHLNKLVAVFCRGSQKRPFLRRSVVCAKNPPFRTLLDPLRKLCAFSYLYPTPLRVVLGLIGKARPNATLHFGCPDFITFLNIDFREDTPSRHLVNRMPPFFPVRQHELFFSGFVAASSKI